MAMACIVGAALLLLVSGTPGLVFSRRSNYSERISVALVALAALYGVGGCVSLLLGGQAQQLVVAGYLPIGALVLRADAVAVVFLLPIFVISLCGALYGLRYWPQRQQPRNGRKLRLCYGILAGSMALVVLAADAVLFIVVWEMMAVAGYFLITTEDDKAAVRQAGYVYIVATHLGTAALLVMFILLEQMGGSLVFPAMHSLVATPLAGVVFVLALFGFGSKAGLMPLHLWLPGGHGSAPAHVSAILSGVMIKTGIYGLVRVSGFFVAPPPWWGWLLLVMGVVSAVMGVVFAIAQHDIKRLLAYHSVENIGIIAMGLGLALLGRSYHLPVLAALGLAGALLHVVNHSLFKSLLFYCAGAVIHATGTQEIDRYGGLIKTMPKTALLFVGAAVAICGLPPLNGFVSEWFIYLGFFRAVQHSSIAVTLSALLAPALALVGGLAVACFVKVFGITFLGAPRSRQAGDGHEAAALMLWPMAFIMLVCVLIGVMPVLVKALLGPALAAWGIDAVTLPQMFAHARLDAVGGCAAALLALVLLVAGGLRWQRRRHVQQRGATWGCGYQFATARIQYTASSFAELLVGMFSWGLLPHREQPRINGVLPEPTAFCSHTPDVVLDRLVLPAASRFATACATVRHYLQHGILGIYILYMAAALALLLVVAGGW